MSQFHTKRPNRQSKLLLWLWDHKPVSLKISCRKDTIMSWLLDFKTILWNAGSAVIVKWMLATFLVSLREVCNSENILLIQSLVREGLDFWNDGVSVLNPRDYQMIDSLQKEIEEISNDLHASELPASTQEVSYCIAGYAAHQIQKMVKCDEYSQKVVTENPTSFISIGRDFDSSVDVALKRGFLNIFWGTLFIKLSKH